MSPDGYEGDFERSEGYTTGDDSRFPTPRPLSPADERHLAPLRRAWRSYHHADTPESQFPTLSRSPSATSPFAPGAHRRSHPDLKHISLTPLAPKYPITPSDYNAYHDPNTDTLHTSSSLTKLTSLPSSGGILTNSPSLSRTNSTTRLKRAKKSRVHIQAPEGAVSSAGFGGAMKQSASALKLRISTSKPDPSWIVQTGLALTDSSRESKGQSWIAKRDSSTSLHAPYLDGADEQLERERPGRTPRSVYTTPNTSRRGSRERRRSRRELAMTPAAMTSAGTHDDEQYGHGTDDPRSSRMIVTAASSHGANYSNVRPDWTDGKTHAETAADIEAEMAEELDDDGAIYEDEEEHWKRGRYDELDFDGQGDDEEEVIRAVNERGYGVGKWVDAVVDALLRIDTQDEDEEKGLGNAAEKLAKKPPPTTEDKENTKHLEQEDAVSETDIETPPENPKKCVGRREVVRPTCMEDCEKLKCHPPS